MNDPTERAETLLEAKEAEILYLEAEVNHWRNKFKLMVNRILKHRDEEGVEEGSVVWDLMNILAKPKENYLG